MVFPIYELNGIGIHCLLTYNEQQTKRIGLRKTAYEFCLQYSHSYFAVIDRESHTAEKRSACSTSIKAHLLRPIQNEPAKGKLYVDVDDTV